MIFYIDKYILILCFYCVLKFDPFECCQAQREPMEAFKQMLAKAKRVVVFTGAGTSAESGIPTFRGAGGWWRNYPVMDLATYDAFLRNPSLVWEFYNYRREIVLKAKPNQAHYALAEAQKRFAQQGRNFTIITSNVDGLHQAAGSKDVLEIHGSLLRTKCTECEHVEENLDSPICEALRGRGAPDISDVRLIHKDLLPHCNRSKCYGMLRPDVVWFGEFLDTHLMDRVENIVTSADFCIVVGSSSQVQPAAAFVVRIVDRGFPLAEFNLNDTALTDRVTFHFKGPCSITLKEALAE